MFTFNKKNRSSAVYIFLLLLFLGALFAANVPIASRLPGGDSFRTAWQGARSFLTERANPYTPDAAKDIQRDVYGRLAREGEYPYRLDIPFYLLLFYFPFGLIKDFNIARALWLSFAEIVFFGVGFLSILLTEWKTRRLYRGLFFLALFLSFYGISALSFGSQAIFTAFILLLSFIAFAKKADEALGILLLFGSIHAAAGGLGFFFLFFLVVTERRWRTLSIALMGLIALLGISFILLPDWFLPYLASFRANLRAETGLFLHTVLQMRLPAKGAVLAQAIKWVSFFILIVEWRNARGRSFQHLLWVTSISLVLTPFLGFPLQATLYPFLFLPLSLVFKTAKDRWSGIEWLTVPLLSLLLISEIVLWKFPQTYPLLSYLYPFFLLVALYWVRWWIVRPPRTWVDRL